MSSDSDSRLRKEMRAAYDAGAAAWAAGPVRMYRVLADALVAASPIALRGLDVLDVGAGTGAASDAARSAGARCIAVDVAVGMLVYDRTNRPPGVAADAAELPFPDAAFDAVVSACCVNHVPDPVATLAEARRVVRPGGPVLASTFPLDWTHPAKDLVDGVLAAHGYEPADWYTNVKATSMVAVGSEAALHSVGCDAGFTGIEVSRLHIETGVDDAAGVAGWRLGMAPAAAFLAGLPGTERAAVRREAVAAVAAAPPLTVDLLVLCARVE
jgi:SAM-dependent methyltransferase